MNISAIHLYSVLDNPNATPIQHAELNLNNVSKSDSYIIKGVSGLDVDEVIHQYYATDTTSKYYNTSMPPRIVSIAIRLNPNYGAGETVEILRNNLQKMISYTRSSLIELRFMNGATHVSSLKGLITKFESSLFSSEPEVQITFKCDDPFFTGPERIFVPVSGARTDSKTLTDNLSSSSHGFRMQLTFPTINTNFVKFLVVSNGGSVSTFEFIIDILFINSTLYFSSERNNRYFYINTGGNIFNMINEIAPFSVWPMMHPGQNEIFVEQYLGSTRVSPQNFIFNNISYIPTYWGI